MTCLGRNLKRNVEQAISKLAIPNNSNNDVSLCADHRYAKIKKSVSILMD